MKNKVKSRNATQVLTLEYMATVLMEEVKAVFGEGILAERICDALLVHFLRFHVCNVEVVYDTIDLYLPRRQRPFIGHSQIHNKGSEVKHSDG